MNQLGAPFLMAGNIMEMIRAFIKEWDAMRIFRLAMGIIALGHSFNTGEFILGVAGAFLVFMAMANIGCCGVNGCNVNVSGKSEAAEKEISFDVVNDPQVLNKNS